MTTNTCRKIGITLASLLLLAWPTAYLTSLANPEAANLTGLFRTTDMPRHAGYNTASRASTDNRPFRLGISLDQTPFAH
ncbi:MAG: hypothetical protein HQL87_10955 [Magnetococcales bacterium]|nr:hypothetical protein [Magnetococcales bacterium]